MTIEEIESELRAVKRGLRNAGVPTNLLQGVSTRALRSARRQTGEFRSNRESRWRLDPRDPQYGTEIDCKLIELRLLGMICEFLNAPIPDQATLEILTKHLGHEPVPGQYRDALTKERLDYTTYFTESSSPVHGSSKFHIGHDDPTISPRHIPNNVSWRTHRSNLIQGNMTLREARTKLVELIGRYFELGEVTINPDEVV